MRVFLTLISTVGFISGASASDCDNPVDQATINLCAASSFQGADEKLNALYRKLRDSKKDDEGQTRRLIDAERAWVAFRDAECDFDAGVNLGGSIYPAAHSICLERLTRARIKELNHYLRDGEGM